MRHVLDVMLPYLYLFIECALNIYLFYNVMHALFLNVRSVLYLFSVQHYTTSLTLGLTLTLGIESNVYTRIANLSKVKFA